MLFVKLDKHGDGVLSRVETVPFSDFTAIAASVLLFVASSWSVRRAATRELGCGACSLSESRSTRICRCSDMSYGGPNVTNEVDLMGACRSRPSLPLVFVLVCKHTTSDKQGNNGIKTKTI